MKGEGERERGREERERGRGRRRRERGRVKGEKEGGLEAGVSLREEEVEGEKELAISEGKEERV